MLNLLRIEWNKIVRQEKFFILFAMLCGFCITFEYAITKPTSNSIFISTYSVTCFPYAWLALILLNFLVVIAFNRLLPKLGCLKLQAIICFFTIAMNTFSAFKIIQITWLPFVHYLWKDIYVLLMFQQLWSVIHSTIKTSYVKYLYGLLFGIGGIGAVLGSVFPGWMAVKLGSPWLLLMTIPLYILFFFFYLSLLAFAKRVPGAQFQEISASNAVQGEGFKLIKESRFLQFILLIVVFMQFGTTLIEYQFNSHLQLIEPSLDLRTQFLGRFFGIINTVNIGLQFIGSFLLVQFIGLKRSHFFIPCLLSSNTILTLFFPSFSMIAYNYGAIKCFEYSLFTILKEMLYNPLKIQEKFQAKAIIDVFAFRGSKALASIFVLLMQANMVWLPTYFLSLVILVIFLLWIIALRRMFKSDIGNAYAERRAS
jgi:ATP/ADP translocase